MSRRSNQAKNKDEKTDRHLQAPQEANRDKHINFLAIEQGDEDPAHDTEDPTQSSYKEKEVGNKNKEKKKEKNIDSVSKPEKDALNKKTAKANTKPDKNKL